ncbi:MAG: VOC family protein [Actinomycetota bacterium]|nr:VOC family protein [Actinomycetota bacterium]
MDAPTAWPEVRFAPRRLAHVNMYVADLDASFAFYHDVCGLELVFDESAIMARFLSNGNSHHDVALMGVNDRELRGRDGEVQKTSGRGSRPGLNHLAFEMATEAELVAGIGRMRAAELSVARLWDHQISRSAYVSTPWQVDLELYADSHRDWRGLYASLEGELLTEVWDPDAEPPSDEHRYVDTFDPLPPAGAAVRPVRTCSATIVVDDLPAAIAYYERIVGLTVLAADPGVDGWAVLGGTLGLPDLTVLAAVGDQPVGFHHLSLEVADGDELEASIARVEDAGVGIERRVEHPLKRSIVLRDPDGVPVEIVHHRPRPADPSSWFDGFVPPARDYVL